MNKKSFFIYALIFILMFGLTSLASNYSNNVVRYYSNIKIRLNNQELTPKDEKGNIVEPFIIDGTTYLPVRAIGNALGLDVSWDDSNNTIILQSNNDTQKTVANKVVVQPEPNNYATRILIESIDIVSKNTNRPISSIKYLSIGETFKLSTVYLPANATITDIIWKSSNVKVAKISNNGVITALSEGTTKITATSSNGVFDSFTLKVNDIEKSEIITNTSQTIDNSVNGTQSNTNLQALSKSEQKNIEKYKSYVTGLIREKMNARGLLDSSMTTQMINSALEDVNSDTIVFVTDYGEKYHTSSCQYLYDSKIAIRKGKAIKTGYLPCLKCNP